MAKNNKLIVYILILIGCAGDTKVQKQRLVSLELPNTSDFIWLKVMKSDKISNSYKLNLVVNFQPVYLTIEQYDKAQKLYLDSNTWSKDANQVNVILTKKDVQYKSDMKGPNLFNLEAGASYILNLLCTNDDKTVTFEIYKCEFCIHEWMMQSD
ncbi:MAG: hypothetical protein KG003_11885 [Bacteroidetes bacterium]|nr:hypothetical protein [Bacteroidota bacterium]